ncbi:hypothetical protein AAVH_41094, partial [Aphelenchoides avenae]
TQHGVQWIIYDGNEGFWASGCSSQENPSICQIPLSAVKTTTAVGLLPRENSSTERASAEHSSSKGTTSRTAQPIRPKQSGSNFYIMYIIFGVACAVVATTILAFVIVYRRYRKREHFHNDVAGSDPWPDE